MARRVNRTPILFLGVAILATLIGLFSAKAFAESAVLTNAKDGLQISPVLVDMNADKGKSYNVSVKVTNVTTQDHTYYSIVNDFAAKDETGNPSVLFDSTLPPEISVRTWISTVPQVTVKSGDSVTLDVRINVPQSAESGGHYGVLRFSSNAPQAGGNGVAIAASTGMLFLIKVAGATTEQASLASFFSANSPSDQQTSFFEKSPISFVTRIKNEGNVHLQPTGQIQIHDMFGGLVSTIAVNDQKSNVLPNSIRHFDSTLDTSWLFGLYTADLAVGYGTHGQAITDTISFWVIPYKIVIAALLGISTLIFVLVQMIKVYNRRIIANAIQKNEQTDKKTSKKAKK